MRRRPTHQAALPAWLGLAPVDLRFLTGFIGIWCVSGRPKPSLHWLSNGRHVQSETPGSFSGSSLEDSNGRIGGVGPPHRVLGEFFIKNYIIRLNEKIMNLLNDWIYNGTIVIWRENLCTPEVESSLIFLVKSQSAVLNWNGRVRGVGPPHRVLGEFSKEIIYLGKIY